MSEEKPFKDVLIKIVESSNTPLEVCERIWKDLPAWRRLLLLPFQNDLCSRIYLDGTRCMLCDIHQVLRPQGWDTTLGKEAICLAEKFMERGEPIKLNGKDGLPHHLTLHRGYHVLRYMRHAMVRPSTVNSDGETSLRSGEWIITTSGLDFLYHDVVAPRYAFVLKRAVLGVSVMSPAQRAEHSGEVPADDVVNIGDVMRIGGFDISRIRAMNVDDGPLWDRFWKNPTLAKRRFPRSNKSQWLKFWVDLLMAHGGWNKVLGLRRQQDQLAVETFDAELERALAWRRRFYPMWKTLKEKGVDFYGENEN